jgi:hypothetical protein
MYQPTPEIVAEILRLVHQRLKGKTPRYSIAQIAFLRMNVERPLPEVTTTFNALFDLRKTARQVHGIYSNHKIHRVRRGPGKGKGKARSYTPEQIEWLMANYAGRSHADITARLNSRFGINKTIEQIKTFLGNRHLDTGRTGCFEKGHKPWNNGTKGQKLTGPNAGTFKKGSAPPNRKPLWDERICSKDGFILMKVPERDPHTGFPTRYKHKHVWIWEQAHGPVPEGMAVMFIDSDKLHCELDNLMLVTRGELLVLNLHAYKDTPAELKPSIMALARLEAKAGIRTTGRVPGAGRKKGASNKRRPMECRA